MAVESNGLVSSYVWSPQRETKDPQDSGKVTFLFSCSESTDVSFKVEGIAPHTEANSFFVQVDDGSKEKWHFPVTNDWRWETFSSKYSVSRGRHELHVLSRERHTKMRRIGFVKGKETCLFDAPGIFQVKHIFYQFYG